MVKILILLAAFVLAGGNSKPQPPPQKPPVLNPHPPMNGGANPTPQPTPPAREAIGGGGAAFQPPKYVPRSEAATATVGGGPPPKFYSFKRPAVPEKKIRPGLFLTRRDRDLRTSPLIRTTRTLASDTWRGRPRPEAEESLALDTMKREATNDALISKHEYENDLQLIEINRKLHAQIEALYQKKVIPRQTFEESKSKLDRSIAKAEESKSRIQEYLVEIEIDDIRLRRLNGDPISSVELAKGYVILWDARLKRSKAAEKMAQISDDYFSYSYELAKSTQAKGATSLDNLIRAQRDAEESAVVLKLAKQLVIQNTKNLEDAKNAVKAEEAAFY